MTNITPGSPPPTGEVAAVKTAGLSPKAFLAAVFPAVGTIILVLLDLSLDPDMNDALKAAIVGLINAPLAFLGAYLGKPGNVVVARHWNH